MDKSRWSIKKKAQYNSEINRRNLRLMSRQMKDRIIDRVYCPNLNERRLDERSFFSMLAYNFPLHNVILKLLRKQIDPVERNELCLSSIYTYYTQKIFPGYYNDRERIIAILNRYRKNADFFELIDWAQYQERSDTFHYLHFLIGIISLDYYLEFYRDGESKMEKCLDTSIYFLKKAEFKFYEEESGAIVRNLLSFAYYMNHDFEDSLKVLTPEDDEFIQLIKRVA